MLIDTHCHLTDSKFSNVKEVIADARKAGVEKIFMPSGSVKDAKRTVLLAEQEGLYAMVGVHPEEIESVLDIDLMIYELEEINSKSNRVIGIGEIGLDFYYDKEKKTKEKQVEIFVAQMNLAVRLRLPVVIHMREAETEMKEIMENMESLPRGQFHCFAGSEDFLKYVLDKGFYVSFAGNISYKSASELRRLLALVPLDRLLLETDSPYLAPEPARGSLNTPANVKIIATVIAKELNLDSDKIIEITGKNALCLYSLDI